MDFHIQHLSEDLSLILCGSDGMLDAADQYCDRHDFLELLDYIAWIERHDLRAQLFVRPNIKNLLYRFQLKKVIRNSNEQLQQQGVFLPKEEIPQEVVLQLRSGSKE